MSECRGGGGERKRWREGHTWYVCACLFVLMMFLIYSFLEICVLGRSVDVILVKKDK